MEREASTRKSIRQPEPLGEKDKIVTGPEFSGGTVGPICICAELCGGCRGKPLADAQEDWAGVGWRGGSTKQERGKRSQNFRTISGARDLSWAFSSHLCVSSF